MLRTDVTLGIQVDDHDLSRAGKDAIRQVGQMSQLLGEFQKLFKNIDSVVQNINGDLRATEGAAKGVSRQVARSSARNVNRGIAKEITDDSNGFRQPIMNQFNAVRRSYERGNTSLRDLKAVGRRVGSSSLVSNTDEQSIAEYIHRQELALARKQKSKADEVLRKKDAQYERDFKQLVKEDEAEQREYVQGRRRSLRANVQRYRQEEQERERNGQRTLKANTQRIQREQREQERNSQRSLSANTRRYQAEQNEYETSSRQTLRTNTRRYRERVNTSYVREESDLQAGFRTGNVTKNQLIDFHRRASEDESLSMASRNAHYAKMNQIASPAPAKPTLRGLIGNLMSPYALGEVGQLSQQVSMGIGAISSSAFSTFGAFAERDSAERMLRARYYEELGPGSRDSKRKVFDAFSKRLEASTYSGKNAIPVRVEELYDIAEGGLASGINVNELERYTKAVGRASVVSTGINGGKVNSGEISTAFSRILGLTKMRTTGTVQGAITGENAEVLGDLFVSLDEKSKGTTEEILKMTQRIAGFGSALKLSTEDVSGLAAMLVDVGVKSELGATALSRFFKKIVDIASNPNASPLQKKNLASLTGLTTNQLQGKLKEDPLALFASLLETMRQKAQTGELFSIMEGFGVKSSREELAFTQVAGSSNTQNLLATTRGFKRGGVNSRLEEINDTASAQYEQFQNELKSIQVEMGKAFFPAIRKNMEWMGPLAKLGGDLVSYLAKLNPSVTAAVGVMGVIAGAMGPAIELVTTVKQLSAIKAVADAANLIQAGGAVAGTVATTGAATAAGSGMVATVVTMLAAPIVVAAIATLVGNLIGRGIAGKMQADQEAENDRSVGGITGDNYTQKLASSRELLSSRYKYNSFLRRASEFQGSLDKNRSLVIPEALRKQYSDLPESMKIELSRDVPSFYSAFNGNDSTGIYDYGNYDQIQRAIVANSLSTRQDARHQRNIIAKETQKYSANQNAARRLKQAQDRVKSNENAKIEKARTLRERILDAEANIDVQGSNITLGETRFDKLLGIQSQTPNKVGGFNGIINALIGNMKSRNDSELFKFKQGNITDDGVNQDPDGKRYEARRKLLAAQLIEARENYNKRVIAAIKAGQKAEQDKYAGIARSIADGWRRESEVIKEEQDTLQYRSERAKSDKERLTLELQILAKERQRLSKNADVDLMLSKSPEAQKQIRKRFGIQIGQVNDKVKDLKNNYSASVLQNDTDMQSILNGANVNDPVADALNQYRESAMEFVISKIRGATSEQLKLSDARFSVAGKNYDRALQSQKLADLESQLTQIDDPRTLLRFFDDNDILNMRVNQSSTSPEQQAIVRNNENYARNQMVWNAQMKSGEVGFREKSLAQNGAGYFAVAQRQRMALLDPNMSEVQRQNFLTSHLQSIGAGYGISNELSNGGGVALSDVLNELKLDREEMEKRGFGADQVNQVQNQSEQLISNYIQRRLEIIGQLPEYQRRNTLNQLEDSIKLFMQQAGLTGDSAVRVNAQATQVKSSASELDPNRKRMRDTETQAANALASSGEDLVSKLLKGGSSKQAMKSFWEDMVSIGNKSLSHLVVDSLKSTMTDLFRNLNGGLNSMLQYVVSNLYNIIGALQAMTGKKKSKLGVFGSVLAFAGGAALSFATGGTSLLAMLGAGSAATNVLGSLADGDIASAAIGVGSYYAGMKKGGGSGTQNPWWQTAIEKNRSASGPAMIINQNISDRSVADHYARTITNQFERLRVQN